MWPRGLWLHSADGSRAGTSECSCNNMVKLIKCGVARSTVRKSSTARKSMYGAIRVPKSKPGREMGWQMQARVCCKLRRLPELTVGLWTVADFAVSLTPYVGTIVFAHMEAVLSSNDQ